MAVLPYLVVLGFAARIWRGSRAACGVKSIQPAQPTFQQIIKHTWLRFPLSSTIITYSPRSTSHSASLTPTRRGVLGIGASVCLINWTALLCRVLYDACYPSTQRLFTIGPRVS